MIEAHYTKDTKVQPMTNFIACPPKEIPSHKLFSDKEANQKINNINNDIYEGTKKEKKHNEFNKSLFIKIFGIIGFTVLCIACFSKIRNFFKKH